MSQLYFISERVNTEGAHEVHHWNCKALPPLGQYTALGVYESQAEAMLDANQYINHVAACPVCRKHSPSLRYVPVPSCA